jgi:hypothetical protein
MNMSEICIIDGCDRLRDKKQNRRICQMHRVRFSRHKSYDLPKKEKLPLGIAKICRIHGELKEDQVYSSKSYVWPQCLACKKISNDKFKEKNPNRDTNILKNNFYANNGSFKLSKEEYKKLLEYQNNVCAICKNPEYIINGRINRVPKRLSIDHCHKTGKIRGLLCHRCNVSLGSMNDSVETLQAAIDYLNNNK